MDTPYKLRRIVMLAEQDLQTASLCASLKQTLNISCQRLSLDNAQQQQLNDKDLLLIDGDYIKLQELSGLLGTIHNRQPRLCLALFNISPHSPQEALVNWRSVKGLFYRTDDTAGFHRGLKRLLQRSHWLPRRIVDTLLENWRGSPVTVNKHPALTHREQQILFELSHGASNSDIANTLCISELTVKSHVYNIFKKIGVENRVQATNWAKRKR